MSDYATDAQMPAWGVALMDRGRDLVELLERAHKRKLSVNDIDEPIRRWAGAVVAARAECAPKPEHPYNPDPVNAMAVLIGESITDDVEAWDYVPGDRKCLRVTRDGVDFIVRVERATEEA